MVQPIDYSIHVQSPFQAALQGYQAGAAIRNDQMQLRQQEQQRAAQLQMQSDLATLASNRNATGADFAAVMTKYPQLSEQVKRSWDVLSEERKGARLQAGSQIYAALQSDRTDIAEQLLRDSARVKREAGAEDEAKADETLAEMIKLNPDVARSSVAMSLAAHMGPEKFAETFGKLRSEEREAQSFPVELEKKRADADAAKSDAATKAVTAKFANSAAMLDLEKKGWDIKKIGADIELQREANRIAAMNAATAREGNALKREELSLKVQEARMKLDEKVREKASTAEAGATSIDNMLNTIERIKTNKQLDNVVGSFEGRMPAAASALDDEESDAIALIETLGSQAFLAQIPNIKGMGALSNAEGEKLQSALTSLSRAQSEKQFRANLDEASRLLKKGRENLARSTGVPLGKPDTPAAPSSRPPLSSFEKP